MPYALYLQAQTTSPALPCAARCVLRHVKSAGIYLLSVDDPLHIIDACALFLQNVTSKRAGVLNIQLPPPHGPTSQIRGM